MPIPALSELRRTPWLIPGLQLAAAVLLAYGLSALAGLPDGVWAVMSALIVARPHAGAALGAGLQRVKGSLVGAAAALAVVLLSVLAGAHFSEHSLLGVAVVATLACASAWRIGWRSAPITALIVLSGSAHAGHQALTVAGLRLAEVGLGVVAGMAVTLLVPGTRSAPLFDKACIALLHRLASQMQRLGSVDERGAQEMQAERTAQRASLRRLGELALGADREGRLLRRGAGRDRYRRSAALLGRVAQDVGVFGRCHEDLKADRQHPLWAEIAETGALALNDVAAALSRRDAALPASVSALLALRTRGGPSALDLPLAWLGYDLASLQRLAAAPA